MSVFIKLGARTAVIAAMVGLVVLAAMTAEKTGDTLSTFSTGGIDLKIDSKAWYNGSPLPSAIWSLKNLNPTSDKFFNFDDIKPGDFGCEVISMHVKKGNAWLCLDFKNFKTSENGLNEPEALVDQNGSPLSELAENLQFFGWIDNGDGKYKKTEKIIFGTTTNAATYVLNNRSYPVGDSKNGGSCRSNETRYVGMCWCAGILTVDTQTGKMSCDGSGLGNIAQTDTMSLDVSIRALESSGDSKFLCDPNPPPPPPPTCKKDKWGNWKDSHGKKCVPSPRCEKDKWGNWKNEYGKSCKHTPKDRNECKNNGWKSCADNRNKEFRNQKECTDYVDSHTDKYGKYHD